MVVKSATKKKLMDLGIAENYAHTLADDKKWDDVKILPAGEIAQLCETDRKLLQPSKQPLMLLTRRAEIQTAKTLDRQHRFDFAVLDAPLLVQRPPLL